MNDSILLTDHDGKHGRHEKWAVFDKNTGELSIHDRLKTKDGKIVEDKIILDEWELSDLLEWIKTL